MEKIKIAVIDDRKDARETVASVIGDAISNLGISDGWDVFSAAPLPRMEGYRGWIAKEKIGILIIDERLGEVPNISGISANYTGSELVDILRKQNKDMLIYGVTSYPGDESLKRHFALFNEVVSRDDFTAKATEYVSRFLRLYGSFLKNNERNLAELSKIAKKIAVGKATAGEKKRAQAIQESLEIPLTIMSLESREEWLAEYEKTIAEFQKIQIEANKYLKKKK